MKEKDQSNEKSMAHLKDILLGLHEGKEPEDLRKQIDALVSRVDAADLLQMEERLLKEGLCQEELIDKCDIHAQVMENALQQPQDFEVIPGHPLDTFKRENQAVYNSVKTLRATIKELSSAKDPKRLESYRMLCLRVCQDLMDLEKHYLKKQNLLYPQLEEHGLSCPRQIMCEKDKETIANLSHLYEIIFTPYEPQARWIGHVSRDAEKALQCIESMIVKEERILFPACFSLLSDEQWAEVWQRAPYYGWCLVEPREGYKPTPDSVKTSDTDQSLDGLVVLPTGCLSLNHLVRLFRHLPIDITFIDRNQRVVFFSDGRDPVFKRKKFIVGRKMTYCFPPNFVEEIMAIEAELREGHKDKMEFLHTIHGENILVQYFRVLDQYGDYAGFIETKQKQLSDHKVSIHFEDES